jgi:uncharacterized membrane protein
LQITFFSQRQTHFGSSQPRLELGNLLTWEFVTMTNQRPTLTLPRSLQTQILGAVAIAGLVATLILTAYAWATLPEQIAVHFGWDGRPNSWSSKDTLWFIPALGVFNYIVFTALRRYPHTFNYAVPITEHNASRQYSLGCSLLNWLKAEFAWLMFYTVWLMFHLASSNGDGVSIWFLPVILAVVFGTIAFWLRQSFLAR